MIKRHFILSLLLAFSVSCKKSLQKKNSSQNTESAKEKTLNSQEISDRQKLIIPGEQLGPFEINKDIAPVLDSLGKPDSGDAGMGKSLVKWDNVQGAGLSIFTTRKMGVENFSRIKAIRTLSVGFKTKENLGVGSTLKAIGQKFNLKKVGEFHENQRKYTLYTSPLGISFEINPGQRCHGVVITEKRKQPQSLYLPFYVDFQKEK